MTIITLRRSSIFGAAVEAAWPSQLIETITADMTTVMTIVASSIFTMGRRPYIGAAGILPVRRREALRPQVTVGTNCPGGAGRRVLPRRRPGRRERPRPNSRAG